MSLGRQGEADLIIDLMNKFARSSLVKRGTKTGHGGGKSGDYESTIDLVLASENLTDSMVRCAIHRTEHGSNHRGIETVFDPPWPVPKHQERLLLKKAPWKEISARIARPLATTPPEGTVQQKTDRLVSAMWEAMHALTPKAKLFPPMPDDIDDEGTRPQRAPVEMPAITMEQVERQLLAAESWKAPGEDGLPAMVWNMPWPTVEHRVLELFQASLEEGTLPRQWRHARTMPLKKPNKEN